MLDPKWKTVIRDVMMAYATTGLKPVRRRMLRMEDGIAVGACAIGVLSQAKRTTWPHSIDGVSATELGYFMYGFDRSNRKSWYVVNVCRFTREESQAYRAGRLCGRLAFRAAPREHITQAAVEVR